MLFSTSPKPQDWKSKISAPIDPSTHVSQRSLSGTPSIERRTSLQPTRDSPLHSNPASTPSLKSSSRLGYLTQSSSPYSSTRDEERPTILTKAASVQSRNGHLRSSSFSQIPPFGSDPDWKLDLEYGQSLHSTHSTRSNVPGTSSTYSRPQNRFTTLFASNRKNDKNDDLNQRLGQMLWYCFITILALFGLVAGIVGIVAFVRATKLEWQLHNLAATATPHPEISGGITRVTDTLTLIETETILTGISSMTPSNPMSQRPPSSASLTPTHTPPPSSTTKQPDTHSTNILITSTKAALSSTRTATSNPHTATGNKRDLAGARFASFILTAAPFSAPQPQTPEPMTAKELWKPWLTDDVTAPWPTNGIILTTPVASYGERSYHTPRCITLLLYTWGVIISIGFIFAMFVCGTAVYQYIKYADMIHNPEKVIKDKLNQTVTEAKQKIKNGAVKGINNGVNGFIDDVNGLMKGVPVVGKNWKDIERVDIGKDITMKRKIEDIWPDTIVVTMMATGIASVSGVGDEMESSTTIQYPTATMSLSEKKTEGGKPNVESSGDFTSAARRRFNLPFSFGVFRRWSSTQEEPAVLRELVSGKGNDPTSSALTSTAMSNAARPRYNVPWGGRNLESSAPQIARQAQKQPYWQAYSTIRLTAVTLCGAISAPTGPDASQDQQYKDIVQQIQVYICSPINGGAYPPNITTDACGAKPIFERYKDSGVHFCDSTKDLAHAIETTGKADARRLVLIRNQFCAVADLFVQGKTGWEVGGCSSDISGSSMTGVFTSQVPASSISFPSSSALQPTIPPLTSNGQQFYPPVTSSAMPPSTTSRPYLPPSQPASTTPGGNLPCTPGAFVHSGSSVDMITYTGTAPFTVMETDVPLPATYTPLGLHDYQFSCAWGVPPGYTGGTLVPSAAITGELTFQNITDNGQSYGACADIVSPPHALLPNELAIAINWQVFDTGRPGGGKEGLSLLCYRKMKVWGTTSDNEHKEAVFYVGDRCESCTPNNIDAINNTFNIFTHTGVGRMPITWQWLPDNVEATGAP